MAASLEKPIPLDLWSGRIGGRRNVEFDDPLVKILLMKTFDRLRGSKKPSERNPGETFAREALSRMRSYKLGTSFTKIAIILEIALHKSVQETYLTPFNFHAT
jgi:hypothetical protein